MSVDNEAYDQSSIVVTSPSKVAEYITSNHMTISTIMILNIYILDQRVTIQLKDFKGSNFHFCLARKSYPQRFVKSQELKDGMQFAITIQQSLSLAFLFMHTQSSVMGACAANNIPEVTGCTGQTRLGATITLFIIAHISYSERCTPERKLNILKSWSSSQLAVTS